MHGGVRTGLFRIGVLTAGGESTPPTPWGKAPRTIPLTIRAEGASWSACGALPPPGDSGDRFAIPAVLSRGEGKPLPTPLPRGAPRRAARGESTPPTPWGKLPALFPWGGEAAQPVGKAPRQPRGESSPQVPLPLTRKAPVGPRAGRFPHRVTAGIALRSPLSFFVGRGNPSPHPSPAALRAAPPTDAAWVSAQPAKRAAGNRPRRGWTPPGVSGQPVKAATGVCGGEPATVNSLW